MVLMKKITEHLRLILTGVRGVVTISGDPNTRSTGAATISINPARHTSKANASGRGGYNRHLVGKIQLTTLVRAKRTHEEVSSGHLSLRKLRHTQPFKLVNVIRAMNCPSALGIRRISMMVWA